MIEFAGGPDAIGGPGEKVIHDRIAEALRNGGSVVLSFAGMKMVWPGFLGAAVGELYGEFDEDLIRERLHVEDADNDHLCTLNMVVRHAKDYFRDPERYEAIVREVMDEWM